LNWGKEKKEGKNKGQVHRNLDDAGGVDIGCGKRADDGMDDMVGWG